MKPFISFIIPVYSVEEKYLRICIESLIAIKEREVEFVFVDDGSPDKSGNICEEYKKIDERIEVIHKENEGASVARNLGIEMCRGVYFTFVDADDWIDPEEMETILSHVKKGDFDIYIYGQYINFRNNEIKVAPFSNDKVFETSKDILELKKMLFTRGYRTMKTDYRSGVVCNSVDKFVRKSIVTKNRIKMKSDLKICEDNIFFLELLFHIENAKYISVCAYHYRMRKTSVSHHSNEVGYRINLRKFYDNAYIILSDQNAPDVLFEALRYRCFGLILELLDRSYINIEDISLIRKACMISHELSCNLYRKLLKNIDVRNLSKSEMIYYYIIKYRMQAILVFRKELKRRVRIENSQFF